MRGWSTHGPDVGLPRGQMGNSEVGHTNIGAGRVVAMDLGQIDLAIEEGSFATNAALGSFIARVRAQGGAAHLMGVVSDGGVHGHLVHLLAFARAVADAGLPVVIHAITDGRDVPPQSADVFVAQLQAALPAGARIGTVIGRYYAMDRDNRWERVQRAFDAMVLGQGEDAPSAAEAVARAWARGETDEFIPPFVIDGYNGAQDGDGFFCLNFRADRAREILSAVGDPDFSAFDVSARPEWSALLGMVDYSARHDSFMQRGLSQAAGGQHARGLGRRTGAAPVPAGRDREIPACHLLPERRQGNARAGRGPFHGAQPQGRDL